MKKIVKDSDNYAKMSVPFESTDKANEAITAFYDELGELRKKYKIRDLLVVTFGSVKYEDGESGEFMNHMIYGSMLNALTMCAYAYGQEKKENEERIGKLLASKTK